MSASSVRGYTGLTTALELVKKGVKVVLLEAQEAGFGGSGRNAGHSHADLHLLTACRNCGGCWVNRGPNG